MTDCQEGRLPGKSAACDPGPAPSPRAQMTTTRITSGAVRTRSHSMIGLAVLVRTSAGRRLSTQAHAFRRQVFGEAMAGWPAADRAAFARLLTEFLESLAEVTR